MQKSTQCQKRLLHVTGNRHEKRNVQFPHAKFPFRVLEHQQTEPKKVVQLLEYNLHSAKLRIICIPMPIKSCFLKLWGLNRSKISTGSKTTIAQGLIKLLNNKRLKVRNASIVPSVKNKKTSVVKVITS